MSLQKFKLKTANTVISSDNASLQSMATDQTFDLFSLDGGDGEVQKDEGVAKKGGHSKTSVKELIDNLPELWDESQYEKEYDIEAYKAKHKNV